MRNRWLGLVLALLGGVASAWAYGRLPAQVPLPWATRSAAVPALQAALFVPGAMLLVWLLLWLFPRIDPRGREPYARFGGTYWFLSNAVLLFLLGAHTLMLAAAVGATRATDRWLMAGGGLLAVVVGNYLSRVEPNWFFGLRTPWTLSDEGVWRKTHRLMGRIVFAAGLVLLGLAPLVTWPPPLVLGVSGASMAALSVVVSYVYWLRRPAAPPGEEKHVVS